MKPHRVYTLFRNLTFALFPASLTLFSGVNGVFFVVAFLAFVAAAVSAFVFPVRQDEPLENAAKVFFGFFGGTGDCAYLRPDGIVVCPLGALRP